MYKVFIRPHYEYAIQVTSPIVSRDCQALESVQKLAVKFVKGLRHVPYETALQQLQLFSLARRRILGNLFCMYKIMHGPLNFPCDTVFAVPTRTGLRDHTLKIHQQQRKTPCRQHAFSVRVVPHWSKLPEENTSILSRDCQAQESVQKMAVKFVKGPRHVPSALGFEVILSFSVRVVLS